MQKTRITDWFLFFAKRFYLYALAVGFILRIVMILLPYVLPQSLIADFAVQGFSVSDITFWEWVKVFVLGPLNDLAFATIAIVPAFLVYSLTTPRKYDRPWGWIIEALLVLVTGYFLLFNDITDEYGGPLPVIVNALLIFFTLCFTVKFFVPRVRDGWRRAVVYFTLGLYVFLLLLNSLSESVFWLEFGNRYDFVAVDYLIYTNEVVGNIMESYPIIPMFLVILVVTGLIAWPLFFRRYDLRDARITLGLKPWALRFAILLAAAFLGGCWLHLGYRHFKSDNRYATQLQENGCWDFLEAFVSGEIDYTQYYSMLPQDEARARAQELCGQDSTGVQAIRDTLAPVRKNIVLITVESLSGDFLEAYGNSEHLTPNLDSLLRRSLVFDNLFATGNRTVRGLEAVTLCLPPCAGESIVKRKHNKDLFSTGKLLRGMGYTTKFFYGGDSYFDNMGDFFGGNGYEIVDKASYDEITFANIWGTCDEDSYRMALKHFDADYAAGKPFFAHIMTISNHRPYTYPDGRIEYDGDAMSRPAAVKYTDWAIGDFLAKAGQKPWFGETVFVILADHCASSAGKTSLPLEKYHIPALIYAPGFIEPQRIAKTCSQIDLMPTLLRLLHLSYDSEFYGQDILDPSFKERAFMATYQDLGYYADGILTVMSPVRQVKQYEIRQHDGWQFDEILMDTRAEAQLHDAISFYQTVNIDHYRK